MKNMLTRLLGTLLSFGTRSMYMRLLYCYMVAIFICNVTTSCIIYYNSAGIMKAEMENTHIALLRQAAVELDRRHMDLRDITAQISVNPNLVRAMYYNTAVTPNRVIVYGELINYLRQLTSSYEYIRNIWVYLPNAQSVVSTAGKHTADVFFNNVYVYDDPSHYLDSIDGIRVFGPLCSNTVQMTSVISYAFSMPLNDAYSYCTVFIDVDAALYRDYMSILVDGYPSFILLKSPRGESLADYISGYGDSDAATVYDFAVSEGFTDGLTEATVSDKPYTFAHITSQHAGYKLTSIVPELSVREKTSIVGETVLFGFFISIALGVALTLLGVRRLYPPIEAIYNQNAEISTSLDNARPIIAVKYLLDIIQGNLSVNSDQLMYICDHAKFVHDTYQLIVLAPDNGSSFMRMRINDEYLERTILPLFYDIHPPKNTVCFPFIMRNGLIGCVINFDGETEYPEFAIELAHFVEKELYGKHGMFGAFGIGRAYANITELSQSYIEALFALKKAADSGGVVHIDEASSLLPNTFEYSLDEEKRIINILKSGDFDEVKPAVLLLLERNRKLPVSTERTNNLLNALAGTGIRALYESNLPLESVPGAVSIYSELQMKDYYEDKSELLFDFYRALTQYFHLAASSRDTLIYKAVVEYLEANYAGDISLQILSDHLNLSVSYISYLFKQVSGLNYVDYVNKFRIGKVKEFIDTSELTIGEAALKAGFRTPNNFNRVFRKYEGITPGEYRKQGD